MANKRGKTYEAPDMAAMMKRTLRAMVRRAQEGDREAVTAMAEVERAVKDALVETARAAHYGRGDYSWGDIARELGITRQAAQKRFALPDDSLGWPVEQPEPAVHVEQERSA